VLSRFISARLFSLPQVENEIKRAPFGGYYCDPKAVNDELKNVQKDEFSPAFQKLYDCAKSCIYASGASFELKKVSSLCVFDLKKKSVLKFLKRTVYTG
jgi:hypothetical protein